MSHHRQRPRPSSSACVHQCQRCPPAAPSSRPPTRAYSPHHRPSPAIPHLFRTPDAPGDLSLLGKESLAGHSRAAPTGRTSQEIIATAGNRAYGTRRSGVPFGSIARFFSAQSSLRSAVEARKCPSIVPAGIYRSTEDRDLQGERGDSNPRPPGPQPALTSTSQAYTALSGDLSCSESSWPSAVRGGCEMGDASGVAR